MNEALRRRLVEIDARIRRANPYPWTATNGAVIAPYVRPNVASATSTDGEQLSTLLYYGAERLVCESCMPADAALIAAAPADLAYLVDLVTLLMREHERLQHVLFRDCGTRHHPRSVIDAEIRASGAALFTLTRAELPRSSE